MHLIPVPLIKAACHVIANVDSTSALALSLNEQIVLATIDDYPMISQMSLSIIQELDKIGSAAIAIVGWMIANSI